MKKFMGITAVIVLLFVSVACCAQEMVCVVHRGEWVWVRDRPSKDGAELDKVRYGYRVEVSEIVNQYAHIYWNGKEGWADVSYFEIGIPETIYTVATEGPLNKRETPDGRYMGKIKPGVKISVLGWRYSKSGELWAKVYRGGYVKAKYLRRDEDGI